MKFHSLAVLMMLALTFLSCASNKNKNDESTEGSFKIQTPIPVGAAHVMLSFVSASESSISATVDKIVGYGATAPSVTSGSELEFQISEELYEAFSAMESGSSFKAEITASPQSLGETSSGWRIVKLLD